MSFARDLSCTIGRVWDADLSSDIRDEYGLSERMMDGIRFDFSHEVVNGRPRPRALVINPHNKRDKVNYPQPVRSRCAWTRRKREREEAMELISYDVDKTCERDFDKTFNDLVERDKALLRGGFTAARPLTACLGFDGADNFTHVLLRLTEYKDEVAQESELKGKQLAVAMGDDHFPRLERIIAPRIGPAASTRTSVTVDGAQVPATVVMCLDYSAARSAYGRCSSKNAHTTIEDMHAVLKLPDECDAAREFDLIDAFAPWLELEKLRNDAHSPRSFPFKCKRRGCGKVIKDAAERDRLRAELAELKADRTIAGKNAYSKAIGMHADLHDQQMPFQAPVTEIPTKRNIVDLLHALDLNLPKVAMKYTILDPPILTDDLRLVIGDFLSEIGCPLDVRDKENRDPNKKWFHGSVWHYDFVRGANKKSYGLHVNIFQLCLLVYGVNSETSAAAKTPSSGSPPAGAKRKEAPSGAPSPNRNRLIKTAIPKPKPP